MRLYGPGLGCALLAVVVGACPGYDMPAPDVVARIDRAEVPFARFELYLRANAVSSPAGLSSEVLSQLLDRFVDEQLLASLAAERGFGDAGAGELEAVRAMIEAELPVTIPAQRIEQYYRENLRDFQLDERVLVGQILVEERPAAEAALEQLQAGADFDEMVRRHSRGAGAGRGGFQGELTRSDLPPRFAEVIFGLGEGEVSEIVVADYGFHLFQVVERHPAETLEVDEVQAEVERRLRRTLRSEAVRRLVEDARSRYNVEIHERNLPFNYAGRY